jgi:ribosomal-protein-alanine N-acetyltransferase
MEDAVNVEKQFTEKWFGQYENSNHYNWAIQLDESGEVIGRIRGMNPDDGVKQIELAYELGRNWWNKGLMTESVKEVIDFFFGSVGFNRVYGSHAHENPASGKVMQKCGMLYEGTMRQAVKCNNGIFDKANYAILAQDYFNGEKKQYMFPLDFNNINIGNASFENKRISMLIGVNKDVVSKLGKSGYSLMKNLLKVTRTKADRQKISDDLNIPYDDLYRIVVCCDMAQVIGLSGKILFYLYEKGYRSIASLREATSDEVNNAVLDYLTSIGKKPTLPACSRPGDWLGAARLTESVKDLD